MGEHTPEVVFGIARKDVVFGETLVYPVLLGFEIGLEAVLGVAFEVGDIETVLGEFIDFSEELPGVGNGVFLGEGQRWHGEGVREMTLK